MTKEKTKSFVCPAWSDFPDIELYMDQVISVLERYLSPLYPEEEKCITSTMINNYVKQRLLPPPENKRYGKKHLAYLFMSSVLKRVMQLSDIGLLLENLVAEQGEEGTFTLFGQELSAALAGLFDNSEKIPLKKGKAARVVRTCCEAFAAILYSRSVFVSASFEGKNTEPEKKEKKEKDKSKDKGKKDKSKDKKDPKEKNKKTEKK